MKLSKVSYLLVFAALTGGGFVARAIPAADNSTRCYVFSIPSPAREPDAPNRGERWCYRQVAGGNGGTYVFNADGTKVRPELAILKTTKGTLNQGSLAKGEIHFQSVPYRKFDPFSVPLEEPRNLHPSQEILSADFLDSADEVLLQLQSAKPVEHFDLRTDSGTLSGNASYLPWRGYWWPMKGQPMVRALTKYDAYASARGSNADASSWETSHHVSHGLWWEGHCNGWAAASILRPEPITERDDSDSGVTFSVSDQKGIVTETDYCSPSSFIGFRGRRSSGVSPADFHNALLHYVGELEKPIAFNVDNNGVIDNRVISKFTMNVKETESGYEVTTKLGFHFYDSKLTNEVGSAPFITKTYRYTLTREPDGAVSGGRWLSPSPGFVWIPLSTGGTCKEGNPRMDNDIASSIVR